MEKELDGDEVIVEIPGAEKKSKCSYLNREVEIEVKDVEKQDPEGLRSREKVPSFNGSLTTEITTVKTPDNDDDDDDDDNYDGGFSMTRKRSKKMKVICFIEFCLFVCITLVLVLSKTMDKLENIEIWNLKLWKWCVLALAVFCGRLFSDCFTNVVLFLIQKEFLLETNVLYFVYRRETSFQVLIWLSLILPTWVLLIKRGVHRSKDTTKILNYITRGIVSSLVVAGAWVLEVLFVHMLYSSFYVTRYFDRIREDMYNRYILQTLSGSPLMESAILNVQKVEKMKRKNVSAWTMTELVKGVRKSAFSLLVKENEYAMALDETKDRIITNELEAIAAAYHMFRNVAQPGSKYIDNIDLLRFFSRDEAEKVLELMGEVSNDDRITRKSLTNFVVDAHKHHKYLVNSLNGSKTAIEELNKFLTGITVLVLIIMWLILTGIATTEVLLFISSQFLLAVFSFGATAKSTLEAIIFVFVKHPFDIGDRCVVDGVQFIVEEMSILTTVFLRYDNEKIYYPNALLATKAISNFNRSPDMSDYVDFDLHDSTSVENIIALEAKIKTYIYENLQLWNPEHSVTIREIEDMNKIKMSLYVTHTINFQNYNEKRDRRSKLMLELKKIFEELGIKYHILPPRTTTIT